MNLKKFISGVSALAIAASAFAAMTITASAAYDPVTADDVVFGVLNDGAVSAQTEFTSDNKNLESDIVDCEATVSGSVLAGNQAGGRTYSFGTPVTSGKVVFQAYITGQGYTKAGPEWQINGSIDGTIKKVAYGIESLPSSSSTIPLVSVYNKTVEDVDSYNVLEGYVSAPRGTGRIYVYNITIDMDEKTVACTTKAKRASTATTLNSYSGTYTLPDNVTSINSLSIPRLGSGMDFYLDSVAFYHIPVAADGAETFTVNYLSNGTAIKEASEYDVSSQKVGSDFTYYIPAYIVNNGTVYSSGVSTYGATRELAAAVDSVDVDYTAINATAQYVEYDANTSIANAAKASNGAMNNGFGVDFAALTVAEDGIYTVTFGTGRTTAESTSTRNGSWKVNDGETTSLMFSGPNPGPQTFTEVELKAGDVIKVSQANSKCALDYVLIQKTADIPVEPTTSDAGFTFKSTIEKLAGSTVTLKVTASNGTETKEGAVDITDKLANITANDLMLAVILTDIPEGVTITSASIVVE